MTARYKNALVMICDEMAPMTAWGPPPATPNLDRLRKRGVSFDAAYTPSPICVPTRAAIAAGRWLHETGCWSSAEPYDGTPQGWAHHLRDAGVETASFGKLHFRKADDDCGFESQTEPVHVVDGIGWPRGLLRRPVCDYDATAGIAEEIGAGETDYLRFDRRVTGASSAWMRDDARKNRPWCAFVSWFSPHYPLTAPADLFAQFDPGAYESGAEAVPDHPILREIAGFFAHDQHFTPQSRGIARAAYYALWSFIDAQVGAVLDALEASGMADETLILFTSDHGEMLGGKGFWGKSTMYEPSVRVPLIIAGAGVAQGRRDDPVSLIDIAPTLCDALGVTAAGFSGRSLLSPPRSDRAVISEYHDGGASVGITMLRWNDAGGRWKYVHYAEGAPAQLFALDHDPDETRNLIDQRPDMAQTARDKLWSILDPEAVNRQAHADQAARIAELGGREAILAAPQWNFTPAGGTD